MSGPSRINDANFNEVYGSLVHEEDKSNRFRYEASRYYTKSSGPQVFMPSQGHYGSPPGQGSVNIGVASGNVNTGTVHGSLHQTEGVKRKVAPRPTYPPPNYSPLLHAAPSSNWGGAHSHIPRSLQIAYTEAQPFHDEPLPPPSDDRYHGHIYDHDHGYRKEETEETYSYGHNHPWPSVSQERSLRYPDSPPLDRHADPPQQYRPHQHGRRQNFHDHRHQNTVSPPPTHAAPLKSRNPFRTGSFPLAATHSGEPPRLPRQHRAATMDYTQQWVASSASHASHHSPREDRSDVAWTVRSPSEDTRSSSGSSSSPVYWSPPPTSSSYATTPHRYSPVPEEVEDYLRAEKNSRSQSSTPDLC